MKHLLTLLLTFPFTLLFSQGITLDSIVNNDLNNGTSFTTRYSYDGLQLSKVENVFEGLDFTINYNDDGSYDSWLFTLDENPENEIFFIYDDNNELDSVYLELMQYGYEVKQIYEVEAENGLITKVKHTEDYGGYPFVLSERDFTYDDQDRLTKISELDIFYYTGDEIANYIYAYENDKLQTITFTDLYSGTGNYKDSFMYSTNELTAHVTRIFEDTSNDPFDIVYTEELNGFNSPPFRNPYEIYNTLSIIFDDQYLPEVYTLMNGDIPQEHVLNGNGQLVRGTWFYTLNLNNENSPFEAKAITVSPNPSTDFVTIDIDSEITKTSIYSVTGDLIQHFESNQNILDVQHLINGSYIITVETQDDGNFFAKLIKN